MGGASKMLPLKWKNVDTTKNKETLQPQDDCWAPANTCLTASEGATERRGVGGATRGCGLMSTGRLCLAR